ncbi:MAG: hypothetical protein K2M65_07695, partial [Muribaculaceae bacterium]|nr:hypothetical protein [Muribaculaceae bacterium]
MMTALMFSACIDDFNYNQYGDIHEGEGDVKMQLTCDMPQSIQLGSRASGTAVEDINNLCVLIYDRDGQLYRKVTWAEIQGAADYTKTKPQAQTSPDDALTGNNPQQDQAET